MKHFSYKAQGVCSREINFDIENGKLYNVVFVGGCKGNTQGVARLAEGRDAKEVADILQGVQCRDNNSCPNQFSIAINKALSEEN